MPKREKFVNILYFLRFFIYNYEHFYNTLFGRHTIERMYLCIEAKKNVRSPKAKKTDLAEKSW